MRSLQNGTSLRLSIFVGDTRREQLAALPFAEKLKILDKLRARSIAIAAAGLRDYQPETTEDEPSVPQEENTKESE
jgi:hypothetical protein